MPQPRRRLPEMRAMVVAPQPEAAEAGSAMLAAGGNALDAALACALTQGVVDPMMCGIGGIATLQVFDPKSGTHLVINGLGTCPGAAREDMWAADFLGECSDGFGYRVKNYANELGPLAVTVPGAVKVCRIVFNHNGSGGYYFMTFVLEKVQESLSDFECSHSEFVFANVIESLNCNCLQV